MRKLNLSNIVESTKKNTKRYSPQILTGIGIAGMITSGVMAVKATPTALKLIEAEKDRIQDEIAQKEGVVEPVVLTKMDTVKATWKCYIPSAVVASMSILCLIGASSVSAKRMTALATAYKLSEAAVTEYKDAVIETIGEKKEKEVRDKVAEKQVVENKVSEGQIVITEKGGTLCYDSLSGRYFKSDIDKIKKAENAINYEMLNSDYASLNSLYSELGLRHIDIGDDLGWNISTDGKLEIDFSAQLADDETPCIVLDYLPAPTYNFDRIGY